METEYIDELISRAIEEDMPSGDITTDALVPADAVSEASFTAKEEGVLAGLPIARRVFEMIDDKVVFRSMMEDGCLMRKGDVPAVVKGSTASILKGERTALNFLQRLSGIATATRSYVEAVKGTKARILDTRKTTPGLRHLEKYAVRMGGGTNHRIGLSDMVLIKDNHLAFVGSITEAVRRARAGAPTGVKVEVEVCGLDGLREAIACGADIIMLDNMSQETMRKAVETAAGRVPLEASGNIRLENVRRVAETGVDYISVGALTHSYKSLDISLEF